MNIISKFKTYNIRFIKNLNCIIDFAKDDAVYFVLDSNIERLYKEVFVCIPVERLFVIDAIEQKKTINTVIEICDKMTSMSSKRNTHLISIGGGITQDITGFVANVLYRGIKWTFLPSTLLAACDSCIGGKTSLNCNGFKNLLGTFYPPDEIMIYPEFFKTLTEGDFYSGLGEVVKFNVMAGKDGISVIEKNINKLLVRDTKILSEFCLRSLKFKKDFIEEDEFDKGRRILLNFAHTFGHAFETASNYEIPHGSAVAMGMIVANYISVRRNMLNEIFAKRIETVCRKILTLQLQPFWFKSDIIISAIRKDKKQVNNNIRAVLMKQDCSLEVFADIEEMEIIDAVKYLKEFLITPPLLYARIGVSKDCDNLILNIRPRLLEVA